MTKTTIEALRELREQASRLRNDFSMTRAAGRIEESALVLESALARTDGNFPECSGNPNSCPENEGFGCCKAPQPEAQAVAWWEYEYLDLGRWSKEVAKTRPDESEIIRTVRALIYSDTRPTHDGGVVTDEMVERVQPIADQLFGPGAEGTDTMRTILEAALAQPAAKEKG